MTGLFGSLTDGFSKFCARSWSERRVFLEATLFSGLMRAIVLMVPFRFIAKAFRLTEGQPAETASELSSKKIAEIIWAVQVASARSPWKSTCLTQALTAMAMLGRIHIPCTLYLGVAKDAALEKSLTAHAWLCSGDITITGAHSQKQFAVISSFSLPAE
jgi:hypothetical protein